MHAYPYTIYMQTPTQSKTASNAPGSPRSDGRRPSISRARSASALHTMATLQPSVVLTEPQQQSSPENSFRTLIDPRHPTVPDLTRRPSDTSKHPELNEEVATLSDKLIRAINHQTSLDDTLSRTKHALEASKTRIANLERDARVYEEKIQHERRQKTAAFEDKKKLEQEVEHLTASLFDEANKMVATANKEKTVVEKKNQQLKDQVRDSEALVAFQIEQLAELKALLHQQMGNEPRRLDSPRASVAPDSPAVASSAITAEGPSLAQLLEAMNLTPVSPDASQVAPTSATSLSHLVKPVCRTDIPAYEDFRQLIQSMGIRSHSISKAPSRAGSGSYGGLNVQGLGPNTQSSVAANAPTANKITSPNPSSGSYSPSLEMRTPTSLKDTKFFKRIMAEDVEPTLRLDLSPTISWLNRRSIVSALTEGSLIVEPVPENSYKLYGRFTPCAICGESRKEAENPRTHAMRMRDGDGAPRWAICLLCLDKVRTVGDLLTYVRLVREGVVKCWDRKEEEDAWEEMVRLRERLFWARMAGGVVPAFLPSAKIGPTTPFTNAQQSPSGDKSPRDMAPATPNGSKHPENGLGEENGSPGGTDREETEEERQAREQLQRALDDSLTTFEKIRQQSVANQGQSPSLAPTVVAPTEPPATPPRKRESGGFPKVTIPKMPSGFSPVSTIR